MSFFSSSNMLLEGGGNPRRTGLWGLMLLLPTVTMLAMSATSARAAAVFPTMNDAGGIYWRSAPNWDTPVAQAGNGVYPTTDISIQCYATGTAVPGSNDTMWVQASVASGPGQGSGWINEHFVNDGQPIDQAAPGVPPCGTASTPTTSSPNSKVNCYGDYCSGENPEVSGCSRDAVTTASTDIGVGELDLRWSPTCKTNWARVYIYPTRTLGPASVYAEQSPTGYQQEGGVPAILSWSPVSETEWSPMIYSPNDCVTANFVYAPGYAWNVESTACR